MQRTCPKEEFRKKFNFRIKIKSIGAVPKIVIMFIFKNFGINFKGIFRTKIDRSAYAQSNDGSSAGKRICFQFLFVIRKTFFREGAI